jgi:hypothetical protein
MGCICAYLGVFVKFADLTGGRGDREGRGGAADSLTDGASYRPAASPSGGAGNCTNGRTYEWKAGL